MTHGGSAEPTRVIWLIFLTGAFVFPCAAYAEEHLPVPYPIKPTIGYTFSVDRVLARGVQFEWWPSRHLPEADPAGYVLTVSRAEWSQSVNHAIVLATPSRRPFRLHSSMVPGLDLSLPGRYAWGVRALAPEGYEDSGDGLLRGAYFLVAEDEGDAPATLFDVQPDHEQDARDAYALSRAWKRMAGDAGFDANADLSGPAGAPDGVVDQLDVLALLHAGQHAPKLVYPLESDFVFLQDFNEPGVRYAWEDVPGAVGYLLEIDKRASGGVDLEIAFTFFVDGTSFLFRQEDLFPEASRDLRDAEFNSMQVGFHAWRVRPVYLDGAGTPSGDEVFQVWAQPFTPTPSPTPRPEDFLIDTPRLLEPEDNQLVSIQAYTSGEVTFAWEPARFRTDSPVLPGEEVPDARYRVFFSGQLDNGSPLVPREIETTENAIPSDYDRNQDGLPDLPTVGGAATLRWRLYAVAPHPSTPGLSVFSPFSATRTVRVSERGTLSYPADADGDDFADALDAFWLPWSYLRPVVDASLPSSVRATVEAARRALDIDQSGFVTDADVLEVATFLREQTFARPSLPAPSAVYPTGGAVVTTTDLTLVWTPVDGASDYLIVINVPPTLANPRGRILLTQSAATAERRIRLPAVEAEFTWQVRAVAPVGQGPGSDFFPAARFRFQFPQP